MRLLVLRHGQTEWNVSRRFQGCSDIDLNEVGRAQAAAAAQVLAGLSPRMIVSSDLRRAADTAQAVADLVGVEVQVDKRLRERGYGPWEGLTGAEIAQRYPEEFRARSQGLPFHLPGIERVPDVAERGRAALIDATSGLAEDDTVLVVAHAGVARQALAAFLGFEGDRIETFSGLRNCHWADLVKRSSGWQLDGYNMSAPAQG